MDSNYLDFAVSLARQAGEIMRQNFALGMKKEWKEDHTPVTETDMAIHRLVDAALRKEFPEHGILSEEGESYQASAEYVWICDPLDGTHNFAHGIPTATCMLAVLRQGKPVVAVIYDPFLDRMFTAEKGKVLA